MSTTPPCAVAPRVLYVIGSMGLGGAEQHLLSVSAALVRRGWRCEVFALDPAGPLRTAFEAAGVPVIGIDLPAWLVRALPRPRVLARIQLAIAAPRLWWHLWRHRPQVIHCFLPAAYIVGGIVSLFGPRMRRIMSRRSLNLYQAEHALFGRLERWLHSRMDIICGNSRAVVADLVSEGVRQDQLRLIYNGVAMQRFHGIRGRHDMRDELGIPPEALVFVIVANLIPYKGHADLFEALGHIRDRLPSPWVCLCVGRDDGIGEVLRDQAAGLGFGERVRLLGSRKDVADLMTAADIGLLCSHQEGFSNAVIEGMACGLPMVVTDVGGNGEAVVHGRTGYVVPAQDPPAFANAILTLALDGAARRSMGEAGQRRIRETFSMGACIDLYVRLYSCTLELEDEDLTNREK